jgi:hypothetical protein
MVAAADQELTSQPTASPSPALQLLLRFLPFKPARTHLDQQAQHADRLLQQKLLEELQQNPLWRFSSLDSQRQAGLQALKHAVSYDAHDALSAYVRLASASEMQQPHAWRHAKHHSHKNAGSTVSPVEVAAELQALYRLVAAEQQQPQQESSQQLSDAEVLQLLEAYVGLDSHYSAASTSHHHHKRWHRHQREGSWDNAAAAVKALHAFAQLADVAQQQQQHALRGVGQLCATPTSMLSSKGTVSKHGTSSAAACIGTGPGIVGSCGSASLAGTNSDMHALSKLAELSSQA